MLRSGRVNLFKVHNEINLLQCTPVALMFLFVDSYHHGFVNSYYHGFVNSYYHGFDNVSFCGQLPSWF